MSNHESQDDISSKAKEAARAAVEKGENIHGAVRDVTLKALREGQLEVRKIQEIVHSVLQGASDGAKKDASRAEESLRETMDGVDEALEMSAMASKLAIEEAAGNVKEFGEKDLKRALDDLLTLEGMFLDTLASVAKASNETARKTLSDLESHARNSGTTVGREVTRIVETLSSKFGQSVREKATEGADTAMKVGAQLSYAAAGFLKGIAESLTKTDEKKEQQ